MFDDYLTPYKLERPVLTPSGIHGRFDEYLVDAPRLFRHNGRIYMMYIGFDGLGYQTALATTEDMVHWRELGVILPKGDEDRWDRIGRAGTCILADIGLYGSREMIRYDGKYWMFYHSYPSNGYEVGPAAQGVAWTEDETLMHWTFCEYPIFTKQKEGAWDSGGLYGNWVVPKETGFEMFYNGKERQEWPWHEQVGRAFSHDLLHWERMGTEPVLKVSAQGWDTFFACGQHMLWDERKKRYVMFYCGYDGIHAQEGVAISHDGIHWEKRAEPIISNGVAGSLDETHAHKPGTICENGVLYHYYCAVRPTKTEEEKAMFGKEYRCITVARSVPWTDGVAMR